MVHPRSAQLVDVHAHAQVGDVDFFQHAKREDRCRKLRQKTPADAMLHSRTIFQSGSRWISYPCFTRWFWVSSRG
jgi:hypothetical protein